MISLLCERHENICDLIWLSENLPAENYYFTIELNVQNIKSHFSANYLHVNSNNL